MALSLVICKGLVSRAFIQCESLWRMQSERERACSLWESVENEWLTASSHETLTGWKTEAEHKRESHPCWEQGKCKRRALLITGRKVKREGDGARGSEGGHWNLMQCHNMKHTVYLELCVCVCVCGPRSIIPGESYISSCSASAGPSGSRWFEICQFLLMDAQFWMQLFMSQSPEL